MRAYNTQAAVVRSCIGATFNESAWRASANKSRLAADAGFSRPSPVLQRNRSRARERVKGQFSWKLSVVTIITAPALEMLSVSHSLFLALSLFADALCVITRPSPRLYFVRTAARERMCRGQAFDTGTRRLPSFRAVLCTSPLAALEIDPASCRKMARGREREDEGKE